MQLGERHVFSWVHISDLHFGHGESADQWDQRTVLTALERDIAKAVQD